MTRKINLSNIINYVKHNYVSIIITLILTISFVIYVNDLIFLILDDCSTICSQKWCSYEIFHNAKIVSNIDNVINVIYLYNNAAHVCYLHHNSLVLNENDIINIGVLTSDHSICVPSEYAYNFRNNEKYVYFITMASLAILLVLLFYISIYIISKCKSNSILPIEDIKSNNFNKVYPIIDNDIESQIIISNELEPNDYNSEFDKLINNNDDETIIICSNVLDEIIDQIVIKNK